jgi:hypothetical protein
MANSFGRTRYRRPEEARNAFRQDVFEEILDNDEASRLFCPEVGGERAVLAWHGPNHSPDNIFIHP